MSLSERHPVLYFASVSVHRLARRGRWLIRRKDYTSLRSTDPLPYLVKRHESPLIRKLGTSDLRLQLGKVQNLRLAVPKVDGVIIPPGRSFSFWRAVGVTSARKGYAEGMVLQKGEATAGVGGGLCQLSNHLHWMALHSPLVIAERHHHGFDPFPDDRRVLPYGSGATVFYNYLDLVLRNPTEHTFQIRMWMTDTHLMGELRSDQLLPESYHIEERAHRFTREGEAFYRENELYRVTFDRATGRRLGEELVMKNRGLVKYRPEDVG
ncbi:MAG: VanW family protein [Bacillota bacterium]